MLPCLSVRPRSKVLFDDDDDVHFVVKMILMFLAFTYDLYYRLYTGMKIWTFFMAATMLLQIVMNLDWLDNLL